MAKLFSVLFSLYFCLLSYPAYAYLGPGMAGGVVLAVVGIIGAFLLAVVSILYFPIKRALKNKRKKATQTVVKPEDNDTGP